VRARQRGLARATFVNKDESERQIKAFEEQAKPLQMAKAAAV